MSDTVSIIDVHRYGVKLYEAAIEKFRSREYEDEEQRQKDIQSAEEEIEYHKRRIHVLETDHADCVEACCPSCKQGGKKDET